MKTKLPNKPRRFWAKFLNIPNNLMLKKRKGIIGKFDLKNFFKPKFLPLPGLSKVVGRKTQTFKRNNTSPLFFGCWRTHEGPNPKLRMATTMKQWLEPQCTAKNGWAQPPRILFPPLLPPTVHAHGFEGSLGRGGKEKPPRGTSSDPHDGSSHLP